MIVSFAAALMMMRSPAASGPLSVIVLWQVLVTSRKHHLQLILVCCCPAADLYVSVQAFPLVLTWHVVLCKHIKMPLLLSTRKTCHMAKSAAIHFLCCSAATQAMLDVTNTARINVKSHRKTLLHQCCINIQLVLLLSKRRCVASMQPSLCYCYR